MAEDFAKPREQEIQTYQKRSFLRLPVEIDLERLLAEYRSIPPEAWSTSHWDVHCSADMLLLRGGGDGVPDDFTTGEVRDADVLPELPYTASLIGADGPFGQSTYAFIFRMKPMGITRAHIDDDVAWKDPFRIHIALTSNPDAVLLSEKRAKHFPVGEAWTFDNQITHAVANGDSVRTHLIIDVPRNPKLDALLERAELDPGQEDPETWQRTFLPENYSPLFAWSAPLSPVEKRELGLDLESFASRVTRVRRIARLLGCPLKKGDIVHSVNGVEACAVARTAIDYIRLRHAPEEVVTLDVLRDGRPVTCRLNLRNLATVSKGWHGLKALAKPLSSGRRASDA